MVLLTTLLLTAAGSFPAGETPLCADTGHCYLPRWAPDELVGGSDMGAAVEIVGNRAVAGAPGEDAVYFYEKQGTTWALTERIASPHPAGADFGAALDFDGFRMIVGAPLDDLAGNNAGAAHVYKLKIDGFSHEETLMSAAPVPSGKYGSAVAIDGLWSAVGEPGAPAAGRVTTYIESAGTYFEKDLLQVFGTEKLGSAVSIDGSDMAVGDWSDDDFGANSGAVHMFKLDVGGSPYVGKLYATDPEGSAHFGASLDLGAGLLVVGAQGMSGTSFNEGAAYMYERDDTGIAPLFTYNNGKKLLPCAQQPNAFFGYDVAVAEGRIAVGAPGDNIGAIKGGKVYVYTPFFIPGMPWVVRDQVRSLEGQFGDQFGAGVSIDGSLVLAGAPGHDLSGSSFLVSTAPKNHAGGGECPAPNLASSFTYGDAKPGTLGNPLLELSRPLVPGDSSTIAVRNVMQGLWPFLIYGTQQTSILFDGGQLLVGDPYLLPLPQVSAFEQTGMEIPVPMNLNLAGKKIVWQAMFIDPGAIGALQTAQTKGVGSWIGF